MSSCADKVLARHRKNRMVGFCFYCYSYETHGSERHWGGGAQTSNDLDQVVAGSLVVVSPAGGRATE